MLKYITFLFLLSSCTDDHSQKANNNSIPTNADSTLPDSRNIAPRYDLLRQEFLEADSVVLFSHHSPNMPIKNPKTGEDYKKSIPFIENDTIHYQMSVQERKKLNKKETEELLSILSLPAVDDSIRFVCFQPRNAVVIFKNNKISCFDFCFDCFGFSTYGSFKSTLIMNPEKYEELIQFYKNHNFKYELD